MSVIILAVCSWTQTAETRRVCLC